MTESSNYDASRVESDLREAVTAMAVDAEAKSRITPGQP